MGKEEFKNPAKGDKLVIQVNKETHRVRFANESEKKADVIIEPRDTANGNPDKQTAIKS